jgi:TolB protein
MATQNLTRITDDPAIDTQPAWSPDGKTLYFMSDRGGAPQIYATEPRSRARARRVSFGVVYAARPRVSPDGKQLAIEVQEGGAFHIATLDLASGNITSLSRGALDESPSFSPNGAMLIYAGRERDRGVLATISVDGQVTSRLQSSQGDVQEPVWGPFTN